jgi:hypothetical protein
MSDTADNHTLNHYAFFFVLSNRKIYLSFRVEVESMQWPTDVDSFRVKSLLLDKIYSRTFFFVEQLKVLANKFDSEIVERLTPICQDTGRQAILIENQNSAQFKVLLESSTVEHIPLTTLIERSTEIDVALRLMSDTIWSAVKRMSTLTTPKSLDISDTISAEKIETVFSTDTVEQKNDLDESVQTIVQSFRVGDLKNIFGENCVGTLVQNVDVAKDDSEISASITIREMVVF